MSATESVLHASRLAVSAGGGLLCRRSRALLFIPEPGDGADELIGAFQTAPGPPVLEELVVELEFSVPPFVLITWSADVSLMVFGDVAVKTDQRSLPMLTGAASATWVEHHMRQVAESAQILVDPTPDDERTDLTTGVVPAAGFSLRLERVEPDPAPQAAPAQSVAVASAPDSGARADPEMVEPAEPEPVEELPLELPVAPPMDDPHAALEAIQAAAIADDGADVASAPPLVDSSPAPASTDDPEVSLDLSALPPPSFGNRYPSVDDPEATVAPPSSGGMLPMVDARMCPAGHPSAASAASCRICGVLLGPDAELRTVPRPSLGVLVHGAGQRLPLTTGYVLGRKPTPIGDDTVAWPLTGEKISRQHARVELRGWEVLVHDLGSTNGTIVVPREGDEPLIVDPGVGLVLEAGSTVYVGSERFVFEPEQR